MKKILIALTISFVALAAFLYSCCDKSDIKDHDVKENVYYNLSQAEKNGFIAIDEENFPDEVFRNWLKDKSNINGYGADGILSEEEIWDIKNITISGSSGNLVKDLKGIEYFSELTTLSVPYNSLTSLVFTGNEKLTYLNCSYNKLTELNVRSLVNLRSFYCEFNYLKELDLSGNPALTVLYSRHNLLEKLDLSNNTELIFIETFDNMLTSIDVSMLSKLEFLHIDHNKLTRLDMSKNLNLKGGGFVVRNNNIEEIILPYIEGFTVYFDDFAEQDPVKGYEKCLWYEDEDFTVQINSDVQAKGQTLYSKRIANSYTVNFNAEGAFDVPSSLNAFYDEAFYLPETKPYKKGYVFLYWSDDKYSSGKTYLAGQSVKNLSGSRYDGEKTTLYAKWQGIKYKISFNKNADDATGSMPDIDAVYGSSLLLSSNAFERNGYDFEGWSLSKDGDVYFNDGQSVSNLSSTEGEVITLYAVWSENSNSVQKPYLDSLMNCFEELCKQTYYEEDLSLLKAIYNNAIKDIKDSLKDTQFLKEITEKAINDMKGVATANERAEQIVYIWKEKNISAFEYLNVYPLPTDSVNTCIENVYAALKTADVDTLTSYSSIENVTDKKDAALNALSFIEKDLNLLSALESAATWISETQVITDMPLSEILPQNSETCIVLTDRYYAFSEKETRYIAPYLIDSLIAARNIADLKAKGVQKLNLLYESIAESLYNEEDTEKIRQIIEISVSLLLSAERGEDIDDIILSATELIKEITEEKTPSDETPGDPPAENPVYPGNGDYDKEYKKTAIAVSLTASFLVSTSLIVLIYVIFKKRKKTE